MTKYCSFSLVVVCVFLLGGCTTSVTVEGTIPTPVVEKIPVNIGIYYSDDFKKFQHEESIRQHGNWKVDMGGQNLLFFRNLMTAVFVDVTEVDALPLTGEDLTELDGILVPEIVKYGFLTPNVSGLKFYSASIHYRMTLYNTQSEKLGEWTIVGYGKSERTLFGTTESLGEATVLAIRDGGARIAMEMDSQPVVQSWLENVTE